MNSARFSSPPTTLSDDGAHLRSAAKTEIKRKTRHDDHPHVNEGQGAASQRREATRIEGQNATPCDKSFVVDIYYGNRYFAVVWPTCNARL